MNSKEKGDLAASQCIAYYMGKEYEVLLPIGDKKPYDMVVDMDGLKKVQCKYTSHKGKSGKYKVPLRVMGGNQSYHTAKTYSEGDFDILFVLTENKDRYEIPYSAIKGYTSTITLDKNVNKYKIV